MKKNILRIIIIILIIFWMSMVFGFSNDNAEKSASLSLKVSELIVNNKEKAKIIEPSVRKCAHLSEYTVRWIFVLWIIFNI